MFWGDFGGAAGAGAFLSGQPNFAAVVIELLHRAGFLVGDGVRGHDGFDIMAGGEVGFDAGAEGGGKGAGHGCVLIGVLRKVEWRSVGWEVLVWEIMTSSAAWDSDAK